MSINNPKRNSLPPGFASNGQHRPTGSFLTVNTNGSTGVSRRHSYFGHLDKPNESNSDTTNTNNLFCISSAEDERATSASSLSSGDNEGLDFSTELDKVFPLQASKSNNNNRKFGVGLGLDLEASSNNNEQRNSRRFSSFNFTSLPSTPLTDGFNFDTPSRSPSLKSSLHNRQKSLTSSCPPVSSSPDLKNTTNGKFKHDLSQYISPRLASRRKLEQKQYLYSTERRKLSLWERFVDNLSKSFTSLLPSSTSNQRSRFSCFRTIYGFYIIISALFFTLRLFQSGTQSSLFFPTPSVQLLKRSPQHISWETSVEKDLSLIGRTWSDGSLGKNPLNEMPHLRRFQKLFSKSPYEVFDEIEPFAFQAEQTTNLGHTTACIYMNEAWIPILPRFMQHWRGPVSLVFEDPHSRNSKRRSGTISRLSKMRKNSSLIRKFVDFHIVTSPPSSDLNRTREFLIMDPQATSFHLNLARFYSRTDVVWIVGDSRVFPSPGLRKRLEGQDITTATVGHGDAIVVPTFASIRGTEAAQSLDLQEIKADLGLNGWGVSENDFLTVAETHLERQLNTLPLDVGMWPENKEALVALVGPFGEEDVISHELAFLNDFTSDLFERDKNDDWARGFFALFDRSWPLNHGPTNWHLWKWSLYEQMPSGECESCTKEEKASRLEQGSLSLYTVQNLHMDYSPNFVISRDAQPWCTERYDKNKAACAYQVYMAGAEFWVLGDEWAWTLEPVEKEINKLTEQELVRRKINKKLYAKYHQETCMHYGRQLISQGKWNSDQSRHVKKFCYGALLDWYED